MPNNAPKYKRVLLKLSGEALMGQSKYGFDPDAMDRISHEIKLVCEKVKYICHGRG